ncbi:crossover junction endodeoxyribonuclease RuvC [Striga asiatica]|uniref:Crossover junction endodeoxyribonuclease RuvC n=1 Tax=Striga asiatica TaxID=4170 RepID=A0A5A7R7B7_STRAF|nr:crossover junction endodeoxyribonuclease RuvC [Striga asiatica]
MFDDHSYGDLCKLKKIVNKMKTGIYCKKTISSIFENAPTFPANESNPVWPAISRTFSIGRCTRPATTLHTINAFLTSRPSSADSIDSNALVLVEVVKTPTPCLSSILPENPFRIIRQTEHFSDVQRVDEPFVQSWQDRVVPKNLSSSLPSARQRGCFFGSLLAFDFTDSRYSSKRIRDAVDFHAWVVGLQPAGPADDFDDFSG